MKLNLRDLFWLILVVGLALALWQSRMGEHKLQVELAKRDKTFEVFQSMLDTFGVKASVDAKTGMVEMSGPYSTRQSAYGSGK